MKARYLYSIALLFGCLAFTACSEDDLSPTSVINPETYTHATGEETELDRWLQKNYADEFNISFQYRFSDKEADQYYNVIPAEYTRSVALAKLVKHVWLEAYTEVAGKQFVKENSFRVIQLVGSYKYNTDGSIVLGTAEGGLKIMLYGANDLDIEHPRINSDDPFESHDVKPLDLNYWYFHTMHHEFCHILTQKKDYNTEFRVISAGAYHASDWINVTDKQAVKEGFVTGYASGEYNEDFAETYANYVTLSEAGWAALLKEAGDTGRPIIEKKLAFVKEYFQNSWGIDLDELRSIVLRRSGEALTLDLRTLD